jgi:sialic acid synthase SpsE
MLEKLRQIGKPVILSTGASGLEDIKAAVMILRETRFVLMYCVAAYPAREINLHTITELREEFGPPVGFSDHSTDIGVIPRVAVNIYGACVIEKHFTDIPEVDTPDRPHSLTTDEFKRMVEIIRNGPEKRIGYTREENPMVLRHNRRLVATKDITPGERLIENENFGIYRALQDDAKGLTPFAVNHVNGKRAAVALKAGEGIGPKDFG